MRNLWLSILNLVPLNFIAGEISHQVIFKTSQVQNHSHPQLYLHHKLIRVTRPNNKTERLALDEMLMDKMGLDVWSVSADFMDVRY